MKEKLEKSQEPLEIYNVKKVGEEGLKLTFSRVKNVAVGKGDP